MDMDVLVKLVRDVGFPIGLVIYLLVRFDKLMVSIVTSQSKELEILFQLRDHVVWGRQSKPPENHQ